MTDRTQTPDWMTSLSIGDEVWWNDPDSNFSSGYYRIADINTESGSVESVDSILLLKNNEGSQSEVYASELSPNKPEGLIPVVCLQNGKAEQLGYAYDEDEAASVANERMWGDTLEPALVPNVRLADGSVLEKAWLLQEEGNEHKATVRLTLDVTYLLNDESPEEMRALLEQMCIRAIGNGMLTSDTSAEVGQSPLPEGRGLRRRYPTA